MDNMNKRHAFTLIEMLVVIAIIGIIAAMVVNMNSGAKAAQRKAQVVGEKQSLTLMIDNYQSKLNFYPPDNGELANPDKASPTWYAANYEGWTAANPLLYELTGATNNYPNTGFIQLFDGTNIDSGTYSNMFGRAAVNNGNADEPHDFFNPGPQPKEYTNYTASPALKGLLVPVALTNDPTIHNFWHYDSSSTNRHNLQSYDLWAEYISATKGGSNIITTNGNW